jgi:hypothetical protein
MIVGDGARCIQVNTSLLQINPGRPRPKRRGPPVLLDIIILYNLDAGLQCPAFGVMTKHQGRWLDLLSFLGRCLRIVRELSSPLFCQRYLKVPFPHGYGNLSEFDIILPAEDRFPGRGRGATW